MCACAARRTCSCVTLSLSLQTAYVLAQLFGYLTSKFVGIKIVSEAVESNRFAALVFLIFFSEMGLVLVGLLNQNWAVLGFFLNGLPLGVSTRYLFGLCAGRKIYDQAGD